MDEPLVLPLDSPSRGTRLDVTPYDYHAITSFPLPFDVSAYLDCSNDESSNRLDDKATASFEDHAESRYHESSKPAANACKSTGEDNSGQEYRCADDANVLGFSIEDVKVEEVLESSATPLPDLSRWFDIPHIYIS
ncbi:hypothetical protein ONZ51_g10966 [Trametes cubensis]|uniref:Uncharacterized protein n=1 Tax=Trametes cubensis TaxID=1111947 RepID=A0AAD7X4F1_9APHY|nr:hypothetical protein ONZ51_g10966 [Trametes cubensis]